MHDEIEVPQDLVEAMLDAFGEIAEGEGYNADPSARPMGIRAMAAALRVALEDERVLGDFTGGDRIVSDKEWAKRTDCEEWPRDRASECVQAVLANRRARLLKPKTPEERVTIVEWLHDKSKLIVLIDGCNMRSSATFDKYEMEKAEIYRLGLIAKLKAEQEARGQQ